MLDAEFILQNLFIIHPQKFSKYRVKIVLNHQIGEENVNEKQQKYHFNFMVNDTVLNNPYGYISLLENDYKNQNQFAQYLEIGKGQLDFHDILKMAKNSKSTLSGVIYGTRATNYDKIIARYSYSLIIFKSEQQKLQRIKTTVSQGNKIKFKGTHYKQKFTNIKFKKKKIDQSNELENRIRKLSEAISQQKQITPITNNPIIKNKSITVGQQSSIFSKQQLKSSTIDINSKIQPFSISNRSKRVRKPIYYYKINDQIQKLLRQQKFTDLKWIKIKSIQIFKYGHHQNKDQQNQNTILLSFYRNNIKLSQAYIKLRYNTNNIISNLVIPVLSSLKKLNIEVLILDNRKNLTGETQIISKFNKTVDLMYLKQELGYLSLEILNDNIQLPINMKQYNQQLLLFNNLKQSQLSRIQEKIQIDQKNEIISTQGNSITFYKNNSPNIRIFDQKQFNYSTASHNTQQSKNLQKLPYESKVKFPQIRRLKDNRLSINQQIQFKKLNDNNKISQEYIYNLRIYSIYIHYYEYEKNQSIFLKIRGNEKQQLKQLAHGYNKLIGENFLKYDQIRISDYLLVQCLADFEGQLKDIGSCKINLLILLKPEKELKVFIMKGNTLTGYIILQYQITPIKIEHNKKIKNQKRAGSIIKPSRSETRYEARQQNLKYISQINRKNTGKSLLYQII